MPDPQYEPDVWLRVKDKDTGYDTSILGVQFPHGNYQLLKQEALDVAGRPLPPDYHIDDSAAPAASKEG